MSETPSNRPAVPDAAVQARAQAAHAARFLGLPLDPAYLDGVAANLELLGRHAVLVLALRLPSETEIAPVFSP